MSKSKGTGVFLDTSAKDMYGQVMAQPDEMIVILFTHCTLLPLDEINQILKTPNPRDAKARLALEITTMFHGAKAAKKAAEEFVNIFKRGGVPDDIKKYKIKTGSVSPVDVLTNMRLVASKSEARRLIDGGGMKINDQKVANWQDNITIKSGDIVQAGKRKFAKVK